MYSLGRCSDVQTDSGHTVRVPVTVCVHRAGVRNDKETYAPRAIVVVVENENYLRERIARRVRGDTSIK